MSPALTQLEDTLLMTHHTFYSVLHVCSEKLMNLSDENSTY